MRNKLIVLIFLSLVCSISNATDKNKFTIDLSPIQHVGDTYTITRTTIDKKTKIVRMLVAPQTYKKVHTLSVYLKGRVKILAVNEANVVTKKQVTVSAFNVTINKKPVKTSICPNMTIISSRKNGRQNFSFSDTITLEKLEAIALQLTFSVSDQTITTNDIFGTRTPKSVGDIWGINKDLIIKEYKKQKLNVSPKNIKGATKLVSLYKMDNKDYLKIVTAFVLKNPTLKLPKNLSLLNSKMVVTTTRNFPSDFSTPSILTETTKVTTTNTKSGKTKKSPALVYSIIDKINTVTHFNYK